MDVKTAQGILGKDRVLTQDLALANWQGALNGRTTVYRPVRYGANTLHRINKLNSRQGQDWRLVFCWGLSLDEMLSKRQVGTPNFESKTWRKQTGLGSPVWFEIVADTGYYLIDFQPLGMDDSWRDQSIGLKNIGLDRTPEALVAEALFSLRDKIGHVPLQLEFHWGTSQVGNAHPIVGWAYGGLRVGLLNEKNTNPNVGVCAYRKWDF